ncbi:MAG: hypothetical protein ACRD2C_08100 [Acidimicrobiales bacterium]
MDGTYGERGITPAMRRIEASQDHGKLVGCPEYALKEPDRFKEKLARQIIDHPDRSAADLAAEIHDGIRYTFAFETEHYTRGTKQALDRLESHGYELLVLRNSWGGAEYKGINCRWLDPDSGQRFEIQFHTPESWAAKQETHEAYEKIDNQRTPQDERQRLRAMQAERSARIPVPPAVSSIQDFRRDDR